MTIRAHNDAARPEPNELHELLERVARREPPALAQLYDATCRWVYGMALRVLHDASAAEEVCLEVYEHIWTQAHRFAPRRGTAHAWLLTITRHRAIDKLRSRNATQLENPLDAEAQPMDPRPAPLACAMLADRSAHVRRALAELRQEESEVIELAFFEDRTHAQIADLLGLPLGTVKTRIRLGLRRLADKLVPLREEAS